MLVMDHPVFRRFWYPVIPVEHLKDGPQRIALLGRPLALFLEARGAPAALEDRCCHRSADSLSARSSLASLLPLPWVAIPTRRSVHADAAISRAHAGQSDRVAIVSLPERYGYAWVALEEPLCDIPRFPEAETKTFTVVPEFYEPWDVAGLLRDGRRTLTWRIPAVVHLVVRQSGPSDAGRHCNKGGRLRLTPV